MNCEHWTEFSTILNATNVVAKNKNKIVNGWNDLLCISVIIFLLMLSSVSYNNIHIYSLYQIMSDLTFCYFFSSLHFHIWLVFQSCVLLSELNMGEAICRPLHPTYFSLHNQNMRFGLWQHWQQQKKLWLNSICFSYSKK